MSKKIVLSVLISMSLFFSSCINTDQKVQTLWQQIIQSQSIEAERSNIDKFSEFLKSKHMSFKVWHLSELGEKKRLHKVINAGQEPLIHSINIEIFKDKTALQLANWEPINSDNVWRLYFE